MSGGHWNYLAEDMLENLTTASASVELLAAVEHELDWGISCDTCYECATRRVVPAMEEFFNHRARYAANAIAILRDHQAVANQCEKCLARAAKEDTLQGRISLRELERRK